MSANDAILIILAISAALGGPIAALLHRNHLDLVGGVRMLKLRQSPRPPLVPVLQFVELERKVQGGDHYPGRNSEVLRLMFPLRYWFGSLQLIVHLAAILAVLMLTWRLAVMGPGPHTLDAFFIDAGNKVHPSVLLFCSSIAVYGVTLSIASAQKVFLRRRLRELATKLP